MHYCYIIYSPSLDKYYVGETVDLTLRISQHNAATFKGAFTTIASDWELYLEIPCLDINEARKFESFIKRMKSRKFIQLIKNDKSILIDIKKKLKV